jgi:competence protein ComEC
LWWLLGYYVLLSAVVLASRPGSRRRWGWAGVCAWAVLGLGIGLVPAKPGKLRCTFLSVGHGVSFLVELPDGRALLYDAGSLDDGQRAARLVRGALAERGVRRLDAIVISHADLDHFNAVPELLRTVPVGGLLVAKPFLDFEQSSVARVCESAVRAGVPVQIVGRGDRFRLDPAVWLEVLHPPHGEAADVHDNANSIVLSIEYAGRRILLTGDLEGGGLDELIASCRGGVDVMLSPHHGSAGANTAALAEWGSPRYVIASSGFHVNLPLLRERYGPAADVLATSASGAVTVSVAPSGELRCEAFRGRN